MKPRRRKLKPSSVAHESETTCTVCHAEFLENEDLRVHIAQMHPHPTGHVCNFCSTSYTNVVNFLRHICDEHLKNIRCCRYCSRAFISDEELKEHEAKHVNESSGMNSCSHCQVLFNNNTKALAMHEANNHSNSKEGVMLYNHYALLSTMLNTNAQIFMQTLGTDIIYICSKCKFATPMLDLYLDHVQEKICITYACDNCFHVFPKRGYLKMHFSYHPECSHGFDVNTSKKECPICKQLFDLSSYKLHSKKCTVVKCKQCNIVFDTVIEMADHQVKDHPMALVLKKCRYCNQEIVGAAALAKHMQRNHKDYYLYKYKCKICDSVIFKHPKQLLGHIFSKHRNLRPFTCDICDIKWRIRKSFTIHIKQKHNSVGFVEFDEHMNVHFSETKSDKPYQPDENLSLYNEEEARELPPIVECETDVNTDAEGFDHANKKKKIKTNSQLKSQETDVASGTDADPDNEKAKTCNLKRKHDDTALEALSSDDEPLLMVKKRAKSNRKATTKLLKKRHPKKDALSKRLTCNICKKFCYTIQNYHRHVALHFKHESKQCIKCSRLFSTTEELERHLKSAHATGHITETLKKLMEKRKKINRIIGFRQTSVINFKKTVRKVHLPPPSAPARLRVLSSSNTNDNVKNFLENFTPEDGKKLSIDTVVSIKPVSNKDRRKPFIKMTKFKESAPITAPVQLAMPKKFTQTISSTVVATVCMVDKPRSVRPELNFGYQIEKPDDDYDFHSYGNSAHTTIIPDIAEEVMLKNTEEESEIQQHTSQLPPGVVLPNVPGVKHQQVQVAYLQNQAPFFKIVPYNVPQPEPPKEDDTWKKVTLPSGRTLVSINPLEHLLGDKAKEILKSREDRRKYYKYKPKLDRKTALAEALIKLETPFKSSKKKKAQ